MTIRLCAQRSFGMLMGIIQYQGETDDAGRRGGVIMEV